MKSLLILGAMAVAGGVAYVMHKPAAHSDWDAAATKLAAAKDSAEIPADVQGALNALAVDAKAAGVSLDSTSGVISQKDPDLDNEYLQIIMGAGGAPVSLTDMVGTADALHGKGYYYESGMVLDVIAATYGPQGGA